MITDIKENFKNYVYSFNIEDEAIKRKYLHSLRVMDLASDIAKDNNFSETDIEVVTVAALLHDYGRFHQWTKYKTYDDLKSVDHADLSVDILFDNEIKNFYTKENNYKVIYNAIKYHNKYNFTKLEMRDKLICDVIRDADKLDILYLLTLKNIGIDIKESISKEVKKSFYDKKLINRKDIKNDIDYLIFYLGFIYDLNYSYSFKYIKNNKLVEKIFNNIKNKNEYKQYFDFINNYIEERID